MTSTNQQPLSPRTMKCIADEMTHQLSSCSTTLDRRGMDASLDGENGGDSDGSSACVSGDNDDSIADESADDGSASSRSSSSSYESSNASNYSSSQEESSASYDSSDSSIDSYSSDESASSSSSNTHTTLTPQDTTDPKCQSNNVFRRRRRVQQYTSTATESSSNSRGEKLNPSRNNNNERRQCNNTQYSNHSMSTVVHRSILYIMYTSSKSTKLLCTSFILWGSIQLYIMFRYSFYNDGSNYYYYTHDSLFRSRRGGGMSGRQKKAMARNHRETTSWGTRINTMEVLKQQAKAALGTAAKSSDDDEPFYKQPQPGKPNTRRRGHRSKNDSTGNTRSERLRDGCSPLEWHEYHYPNCNEIHEIDLRDVVKRRRFGVVDLRHGEGSDTISNAEDGVTNNNNFPWGFVGNGLWRDVFSCDPHQEIDRPYTTIMAPAVLKMMKSEHPYDQRNFQRHRRDALVMELLSSSHHLVPIYGYCANTVLTKAISHTLDDVIYAREKERVKSWSPEGGYRTKPKIESWMGRDAATGELLATRETELGRIRLALGVFRGLMDLHQGVGYKNKEGKMVEWLPIIHADLQAKQYLVDSTTGDVYLNDFNRCRFVTKRDENNTDANATTLESCPVYIPTAPGSSRSPEEYDSAPLSEKLDVYSAGNILYGIITGERPWDDQRGKHIKASIQRGDRPKVNETIRNAAGTVDAELSRLLDRVYEGDPVKRASAKEIVQELESLLEKELLKSKEQR